MRLTTIPLGPSGNDAGHFGSPRGTSMCRLSVFFGTSRMFRGLAFTFLPQRTAFIVRTAPSTVHKGHADAIDVGLPPCKALFQPVKERGIETSRLIMRVQRDAR